MQRYNPKELEPRWQAKWEADKIYEASEDAAIPKKYILEYFPYPSGAAMHVGHVRNYTIGDVLARHARMTGHNVLHPMGWDAFGLPAENYAIKTGISPRQAIDDNTAKFKQQLMQMGFSYDWSREIDSTDPKYYRWTQWFFLMLFKLGLAYQQESLQWWCPHDKTVLANEQVEAGKCWRCGHDVEKKLLKQWFFKITDYADRLAVDLDDVDWSDSIKSMQRNWIGRSTGAEIDFKVDGIDDTIKVFTTRPDTLFGATFMVLAPEHPLVESITTTEQKTAVSNYIKAAQAKSDIERQETNREKTGVFTGAYAVNPINNEKIPVWIADYVLAGYGTGAIMAVPGHDQRDYDFAKQYDLSIVEVVQNVPAIDISAKFILLAQYKNKFLVKAKDYSLPRFETGTDLDMFMETRNVTKSGNTTGSSYNGMTEHNVAGIGHIDSENDEYIFVDTSMITNKDQQRAYVINVINDEVYTGEGDLKNSGSYDDLPTSLAREKIVKDLEARGAGKQVTNYRMRDWLISRQRYWGAPIPIVHCPKDGAVAVPDDQLPVTLPEIQSFEPSGDGRSPLANVPEFVNTTCPTCGRPAERETDTMDGFACSSWYFLRFADPHNDTKPFDQDKVKFWLPVDDYIGGAEHAVMHLLYARFWTKVMHDQGMIDFDEPFKTLRNQGMILAPDGAKMSKSKGNTIEPGVLIDQGYGADSVRIMELFIGPWNQAAAWSVEGMGGAFRFLQRVWTLVQEYNEAAHDRSESAELRRAVHKTIKKVSEDVETLSFNTAISALMELVNDLFKMKAADKYAAANWQESLQILVQLLAPFAPHIAEELWQQLGQAGSVHQSDWPVYDEQYLVEDTLTLAIQVNGKLRGEITVPAGASQDEIIAAAHADQKVAQHLAGQTIRKSIYVPGRLVNFVI